MDRHFYRCSDCLTVSATDGSAGARPQCGQCGGTCEHMGQVERDRLVTVGMECPCDDRCTSARGPKCGCKCGGKNHGSHITVLVIRDRGEVPILDTRHDLKAKDRAEEYRAAMLAAEAEARRLSAEKRAAGWLSSEDFAKLTRTNRARTKAARSRVHSARMKILAAYAPLKPAPQIVAFPKTSGRQNQAALFA